MQLKRDNISLKQPYFMVMLWWAVMVMIASCSTKHKQVSSPASVDLSSVLQPVNETVLADVGTIHAIGKTRYESVHARGDIDYDTRGFYTISSRFSGRIEKLYVKSAYQEIRKGELLFEIYSPEVVAAEQDLIFLIEHDSSNQDLIGAAKSKLQLLGVPEERIQKLMETKKVDYLLPVYSPYEGHIHEMNSQMMTGNSDEVRNFSDREISFKEGMYVEKGDALYSVVDAHRVLAVLEIYQEDIPRVKLHQTLELSFDDQPLAANARVDFIEPAFGENDQTERVRVYLDNLHHMIKVGSKVSADIKTDSLTGLWLPKTAVWDAGSKKVVFQKKGKVFVATEVSTGPVVEENILIRSGLDSSAEVVLNAAYLVDSEGFIKVSK